jgi:hypothetical protein
MREKAFFWAASLVAPPGPTGGDGVKTGTGGEPGAAEGKQALVPALPCPAKQRLKSYGGLDLRGARAGWLV